MPPLQLLRPVETDHVTQFFGDNQACCRTTPGGAPRRPYQIVDKVNNVCPQGSRDFYKLIGMHGHNGRDNATWHGEPVYHSALFSGTLKSAHDQDGGLNVMVVSDTAFMPCTAGCPAGTMHNVLMIYAHGMKMIGYDGLKATPGQNIMLADNSGDSSGDHCHWAPKWCNADGTQIHTNNGYSGAFWDDKFFTNTFILDYLNSMPAAMHPVVAALPSIPQPVQLSPLDCMRKALFNAQISIQKLIHTGT